MFIWDWFTGVLGFLGESLFTNNIYLFQNFPVNIESTFGDKYGHTSYNIQPYLPWSLLSYYDVCFMNKPTHFLISQNKICFV